MSFYCLRLLLHVRSLCYKSWLDTLCVALQCGRCPWAKCACNLWTCSVAVDEPVALPHSVEAPVDARLLTKHDHSGACAGSGRRRAHPAGVRGAAAGGDERAAVPAAAVHPVRQAHHPGAPCGCLPRALAPLSGPSATCAVCSQDMLWNLHRPAQRISSCQLLSLQVPSSSSVHTM